MGRNTDDYKTAKSISEEEQDIENLCLDTEEIDEENETVDSYDNMGREYFDVSEFE
jgi:hypothetical protein